MQIERRVESASQPVAPEPVGNARRRFARGLAGVGLGSLTAVLGFAWGARAYVQQRLLPNLEVQLERALGRDVELGKLQFVLPWQVAIGRSQIEDLADVRAIRVGADIGALWRSRELGLAVTLDRPEIQLAETQERGWLPLAPNLDGTGQGTVLPASTVTLTVRNGTVTAQPLVGDMRTFERVSGRSRLMWGRTERDRRADFQLRTELDESPIELDGRVRIPERRIQLAITGEGVPAALLTSIVPNLPLTVAAGEADVDLELGWQPQQPLELDGTVTARQTAIALSDAPVELNDLASSIQLQDGVVRFTEATGTYRQIPFAATGTINWSGEAIAPESGATSSSTPSRRTAIPAGFQLQARVEREPVTTLIERLGVRVPLDLNSEAAVDVAIVGPLQNPQVSGRLRGLTPMVVDEIDTLKAYSGNFAIEGAAVTVSDIQARLSAGDTGQIEGAGRIDLRNPAQTQFQLDLADAEANALASAYGADLPKSGGTLSARATIDLVDGAPAIAADWQLDGGDVTGLGQLAYQRGDVTISNAQLDLGGGKAIAEVISVAPEADRDRQFTATIQARDIDTGFFAPAASGPINADLDLSGSVAEFGLDTLQASGQAEMPAGVATVPGPIAARVQWDGQAVTITDGTAIERVSLNGRIPFNAKTQTIGPLDIDVSVAQLPLTEIPQLQASIPASGVFSLNGRLTGTPDTLQLDSQIDLQQFQAGGLTFATLQGPLQWQPGAVGINLDLRAPAATAETGDRVALQLEPDFTPVSFAVRQGQIEALGQQAEDNPDEFEVQLQQIPLALASALTPGDIAGILSGNFRINFLTQSVNGRVQADQLAWSGLRLRQLQTGFDFSDRQLTLADGEIAFADSLYRFDGSATLPANREPAFDLRLATDNGSLQDLIQTLHLRQWNDLTSGQLLSLPSTSAADLAAVPALNVLPRSLYDRLEAYSSVLAVRRARKGQKLRGQIPELEQLQGNFEAELRLSGTPTNMAAGFSLSGQDWTLDPYQLDTVSLRGSYRDSELTLAALEATQDDRSGSFVGTLGLQQQEGQLDIEKFPVEILSQLLPDVPEFRGDLDASAVIGGNLQDPQAKGELQLVNAFLNGEPLETVSSAFNYRQGRLEVDGTLLASGSDPLSLQGNIPYRLPFATVSAPSDRLDLNVRVQNEGLKMLHLFTDAIRWNAGEGLLDIAIGGTLREPTVSGSLSVSEGVISAPALPAPIQQLTGTVEFDRNRLNVPSLAGNFSQGTLSVVGQLPINSQGASDISTPLALSLANIDLTLANDLYSGGVDGRVVVTGTAFQPQLGGRIELSNGDIDVGDRGSTSDTDTSSRPGRQIAFNNLSLALGDRVEVKQGRLFSFTAVGNLDIGGTLADIQPEGTIRLDRGRLNLGAASFRLDRSHPNTAIFSADAGLDPLLDVRVFTQATEVAATPNSPTVFDRNPSEFGSQQNVRIQATVRGRASEINNSTTSSGIVELTSSPARTEEEIVALLGGNAIGNIGNATLASFALAALQFSIQDSLGDFFGLDELRINSFANPDGSDFGLGLEAAKDLGRDVSISLQRTFTDPDEDTRYNLRYRINDSILLRSGTDFQGDSQGSIEYETRF